MDEKTKEEKDLNDLYELVKEQHKKNKEIRDDVGSIETIMKIFLLLVVGGIAWNIYVYTKFLALFQ